MSVYPDSDKVSGPEGILLRSSAVGYWHGEGTAGPSEPAASEQETADIPPRPVVNVLAERGPVPGAGRLDGNVLVLEPGASSEPYHYVYGREAWLLVLDGAPTLRHVHGEDGAAAHSVCENRQIASPSIATPSSSTTAASNSGGRCQPHQLTPESSVRRADSDTSRWPNMRRRIGSTA